MRARRKTCRRLVAFAIAVSVVDAASNYSLVTKIVGSESDLLFGQRLASDGENLVVATHGTNENQPNGISHFELKTGKFIQSIGLNYTTQYYSNYHVSLAIEDDLLVIRADTPGKVFLYSLLTGSLLKTFASPSGDNNFGRMVAIDGDHVLVSSVEAGRDTVFLYSIESGNILQTYTHPTERSDVIFGFIGYSGLTLAIEGDNILVGSPCNGDWVECPGGEAFLFNTGSDTVVRAFQNPFPEPFDKFGYSVGLEGDAILIGQPHHETYIGEAYLFQTSTGALLATIECPGARLEFSVFGVSVDIQDNLLFIGSGYPDHSEEFHGKTYIYNASTLDLIQTISGESDEFGLALSASRNGYLVVGQPDEAVPDLNYGSVFIYKRLDGEEPTGTPISGTPSPAPSAPTPPAIASQMPLFSSTPANAPSSTAPSSTAPSSRPSPMNDSASGSKLCSRTNVFVRGKHCKGKDHRKMKGRMMKGSVKS